MFKNTFCYSLIVASVLFIQTSQVEAATTSGAVNDSDASTSIPDRAAIEMRVREYFSDTPVMIEIARCESNFRQFTDSGSVLEANGMIGVFQLYGDVHQTSAVALGFDINTLEGNIGYAKHLYQSSGTTPWRACVPTSTQQDAETQLKIELMNRIISLLQQLLALQLAVR